MNHIIVEGFMGSGKSKVAKTVAKNMGLEYIDVDKKITTKMNMSVNDIFERFGEAYFRAMESFILNELLEEKERRVICIGGGLATIEQNDAYLKKLGKVVYLKNTVETLAGRLEEKRADDPFYKGVKIGEKVRKLLAEREPCYERVADLILKTDDMSTEEIAAEIQKQLG